MSDPPNRKPDLLLHEPLGNENPYAQLPWERNPRHPKVGEGVGIGVSTPADADVQAVRVEWWTPPEGKRTSIKAKRAEEAEGSIIWRAELPPSSRRRRVAYQIFGCSDAEEFASGAYQFDVREWVPIEKVTTVKVAQGRFIVHWSNEKAKVSGGIRFDLPGANKLRSTIWVGDAPPLENPSASTQTDEVTVRETGSSHDRRIFRAGDLEIEIALDPMEVKVVRSDGVSLLEESEPAEWLVDEGGVPAAFRQSFRAYEDDQYVGFGERFNSLDQHGNWLDVHVFDPYKKQANRTYLPVPFFLNPGRFAHYMETLSYVSYDMGCSSGGKWTYEADVVGGESLSWWLLTDKDPLRNVGAFSGLVGKPTLPPAWVFGPWMSSNEWNSQARVLEEVGKTTEHEVPATVLVIEAWSDEETFYIWNDAKQVAPPSESPPQLKDFDFPVEGRWPDPKGMIEALHQQGIRVLLWQIPVLKKLDEPHAQHDLDEETMIKRGFSIRDKTGGPYRVEAPWFKGGLVLDFTNPKAVDWWLNKRAYLLDELEVDGFKTDGGEHLWGENLQAHDGRSSHALINEFPNLYIGAYHEFAQEKRNGDAVTFSRAGHTGAQHYPAHWSGDDDSTWGAFRKAITAGLTTGVSGVPFWGWDIGGFSGEIPGAELFLRSTAMATFCPIMQYHSEFNEHREPCIDRTPWNIQARTNDDRVISMYRRFANLRMNLHPYIYSEAWKCSRNGIPLMTPMVVQYPDDREARRFPYQYLFGESLLVAPVVQSGVTEWRVYLPEGKWYDFWSGTPFRGPKLVEVEAPLEKIPVFIRAGSLVTMNLPSDLQLGGPVGNQIEDYRNLCFKVAPGGNAGQHWAAMIESEIVEVHQEAVPGSGAVSLLLPPMMSPYNLLVVGQRPTVVEANDRRVPLLEEGVPLLASQGDSWRFEASKGEARIRLMNHHTSQKISIIGL